MMRPNRPEQLWDRVDSQDPNRCWVWQGPVSNRGYGQMRVNGRQWSTHRLAFTLAHGLIPNGLLVCHHCDNPPCINPAHLFSGTSSDNMLDASAKGRLPSKAGDLNPSHLHPETRARGERHGQAKLRLEDVRVIRTRIANGEHLAPLASEYGVSVSTISFIKRGDRWRQALGVEAAA